MIWGTVALVGAAMLVALPILAHRYLHDDRLLAGAAVIPLAAAAAGMFYSHRGQTRAALATLATLGVVLVVALLGFGAARVDRYQDSPWIAQSIAAGTPSGQRAAIGSFRCFRPSYVFYTGRPIGEFESGEEVESFFASHAGAAFVITTDEAYAKIAAQLPRDVGVLESHPRFLRPGRALVLGRSSPPSTATKPHDLPPALH